MERNVLSLMHTGSALIQLNLVSRVTDLVRCLVIWLLSETDWGRIWQTASAMMYSVLSFRSPILEVQKEICYKGKW
jgi:hypothetical protein